MFICVYTHIHLMTYKLMGCVYIHTCLYTLQCTYQIMSRMNIVLDDSLEDKFRNEVYKRFGMKKGNISMAIEEAVKLWIKRK
jgi:hypothetical protein